MAQILKNQTLNKSLPVPRTLSQVKDMMNAVDVVDDVGAQAAK